MDPDSLAYSTLPGLTTIRLDVGLQVNWLIESTVSVVIDVKFSAERKKDRMRHDPNTGSRRETEAPTMDGQALNGAVGCVGFRCPNRRGDR